MNQQSHKQWPACFRSGLAIVVVLLLFSYTAMARSTTTPQDSVQFTFTVAKVYMAKYSEPGTVQVTFYESARFYKVEKTNPQFNAIVSLLKTARDKRKPVKITLKGRESDVIMKAEEE